MLEGTSHEELETSDSADIKKAVTMSLAAGSFVICWSPVVLSLVIEVFLERLFSTPSDGSFVVFLHAFSLTLPYVNTAIVPVIYVGRMKDLRHAIRNFLTCVRQTQPKNIIKLIEFQDASCEN